MTSAPASANIRLAIGPGSRVEKSRTHTPSNGLMASDSAAVSVFVGCSWVAIHRLPFARTGEEGHDRLHPVRHPDRNAVGADRPIGSQFYGNPGPSAARPARSGAAHHPLRRWHEAWLP